MPPVSKFEQDLRKISHELEQNREMIERIDEVICSKASKVNIHDINKEMEDLKIVIESIKQYNQNDIKPKSTKIMNYSLFKQNIS